VWWRKERHRQIPGWSKQHSNCTSERCSGDIAKAADSCAETGNIAKAIKLDVEQMIYETKEFLNAASLINRISKN